MQSLEQALALIRSGRGLDGVMRCGLDGCPEGGWAETAQARGRMADELPRDRTYTVRDLIDALYTVDSAGRYRVRARRDR